MPRLALAAALAAVLATGAWAGPAGAQATPLFPGATYEQSVEFTPHGPVSIHVVRGPRPVGLYRLRPVLSNESIVQRETLSAMEKRAVDAGDLGRRQRRLLLALRRPTQRDPPP